MNASQAFQTSPQSPYYQFQAHNQSVSTKIKAKCQPHNAKYHTSASIVLAPAASLSSIYADKWLHLTT